MKRTNGRQCLICLAALICALCFGGISAFAELRVDFVYVDKNGNEIGGADFELLDPDGDTLWSWTGYSNFWYSGLSADTTYTLRQTKAAPGCAAQADCTFMISASGAIVASGGTVSGGTIRIVSGQSPREVRFLHVDGNGNELGGSDFALLGPNGDTLWTWTGCSEFWYSGLEAGKAYTLRETKTQSGYAPLDDRTITIAQDGTVRVDGNAVSGTVRLVSDPAGTPYGELGAPKIRMSGVWKQGQALRFTVVPDNGASVKISIGGTASGDLTEQGLTHTISAGKFTPGKWYELSVTSTKAGYAANVTAFDICMLPADADTLALPADLTAIRNEAFMGDAAQAVVIPEGVAEIGARAFADCPNLLVAELQGDCPNIARDAFEGDAPIMVYGIEGSCVETYAAGAAEISFICLE